MSKSSKSKATKKSKKKKKENLRDNISAKNSLVKKQKTAKSSLKTKPRRAKEEKTVKKNLKKKKKATPKKTESVKQKQKRAKKTGSVKKPKKPAKTGKKKFPKQSKPKAKSSKTKRKSKQLKKQKAAKRLKKDVQNKKRKKRDLLDIDNITDETYEMDASELLEIEEEVKKKRKGKKSVIPEEVYSSAKNDTMKVYMQEIGQISLVTKEQEVELAAKIHGNDPMAREAGRTELIKANLRLVVKIAHDFKGLGLPLLDLISEGNIGLMRAVEKFDPAKGAKFSSYAAWWIKQSMRRALANQSKTIRIPVQSAGKINKIKNAKQKLSEKLNREPSDAEIAEFLEFSERTVSGLRLADLKTFSLHDPIQQGEEGEFQDIIPDRSATMPDRILGDRESIARLNELLAHLEDREKRILRLRFGLDGNRPKTLEEVSQEIGRTRERVRQIQNQALIKLKNLLSDETGVTFD